MKIPCLSPELTCSLFYSKECAQQRMVKPAVSCKVIVKVRVGAHHQALNYLTNARRPSARSKKRIQ